MREEESSGTQRGGGEDFDIPSLRGGPPTRGGKRGKTQMFSERREFLSFLSRGCGKKEYAPSEKKREGGARFSSRKKKEGGGRIWIDGGLKKFPKEGERSLRCEKRREGMSAKRTLLSRLAEEKKKRKKSVRDKS